MNYTYNKALPSMRAAISAAAQGSYVIPAATADILSNARVCISFTRDIRPHKLAEPDEREGVRKFEALFEGRQRLMGREIVNWNLIRSAPQACLSDKETTIHPTFLVRPDKSGFTANPTDPESMLYWSTPSSLVYKSLAGRDFKGIGIHMGLSCEKARLSDWLFSYPEKDYPILPKEVVLSRTVDTLNSIKATLHNIGFPGFIAVETHAYQKDPVMGSAYEYLCEPAFIRKVLSETSYTLLMDTSHLIVSSANLGFNDPLQYVSKITDGYGHRLSEIHLTVPQEDETGVNTLLDTHLTFWETAQKTDAASLDLLRHSLETLLQLIKIKPPSRPLVVNFETPAATAYLDAAAVITYLSRALGEV